MAFSPERGEGHCTIPKSGEVVGQAVGKRSVVEKDAAGPASRAGDERRFLAE